MSLAHGGRPGFKDGMSDEEQRKAYEKWKKELIEALEGGSLEGDFIKDLDSSDKTSHAQGGRIGFKSGSDDRPHKNIGKYQEAAKILKIDLEALSPKELSDFVKRVDNLGGKAQGGRIGYARGRVVHPGGYAGDPWDPPGFL